MAFFISSILFLIFCNVVECIGFIIYTDVMLHII